MVKNLCFGFQHTVTVTQIFQMAGSDVGDHTGIRLCDRSQTVHLSKITDSHLQNCDLILFTETKYRQRKSQFVVKVSKCF